MRTQRIGWLAAGLLVATSAGAHHSFGTFLMNENIELKGVVTKFDYVNPHAWLHVDATGADGKTNSYRCEMRSATTLRRSGWTPEMFAAGTRVTVQGSPDRVDPHACYVSTLIFADGTKLDRYGQRIEATPTVERAARTPSGEPNIAGDWAQEQLVMTDPKGLNGTLVPLSKAGTFAPGGVPEGQREIAGARGTAEANAGGLPANRPPPRAAVELTDAGKAAMDKLVALPRAVRSCMQGSIVSDWGGEGVNRITQGADTIKLRVRPARARAHGLHEGRRASGERRAEPRGALDRPVGERRARRRHRGILARDADRHDAAQRQAARRRAVHARRDDDRAEARIHGGGSGVLHRGVFGLRHGCAVERAVRGGGVRGPDADRVPGIDPVVSPRDSPGDSQLTTDAASAVERFGYAQELKRSLRVRDLVVYGLVFIAPTAPFGIFGFVYNASRGMVPLVYAVGAVAMLFTALSYMTMARAYPLAGSVYSYAGRAIGGTAGFFAGWAMLLDYVLLPALGYAVVAIAMQAVVPAVPRSVWIVTGITFSTAVNFLGIEATSRMNTLLLVVVILILVAFMAVACVAVSDGVAGAHWSTEPFFRPSEIRFGLVFGALSLAVLSFLGFDAISTLAEEASDGARAVGRATILSLCLAGILFVAQTYLASLFVLGRTTFAAGEPTDAAFYDIAAAIGGPWLTFLVSVFGTVVSVAAGSLTTQVATARVLYGMARDGRLPRALSVVHPKRKVPERAILLVAAVNLAVGLTLANRIELLTSMVNFGALTGFLLLHVSVIVQFMWRQRSGNWLRHLLAPAIGFAIIAYVLLNMAIQAKIAGALWLVAGIAVLGAVKLAGGRGADSSASRAPP